MRCCRISGNPGGLKLSINHQKGLMKQPVANCMQANDGAGFAPLIVTAAIYRMAVQGCRVSKAKPASPFLSGAQISLVLAGNRNLIYADTRAAHLYSCFKLSGRRSASGICTLPLGSYASRLPGPLFPAPRPRFLNLFWFHEIRCHIWLFDACCPRKLQKSVTSPEKQHLTREN